MAFNNYIDIRAFWITVLKGPLVYRSIYNLIIEEVPLVRYDCSSLLKQMPLLLGQGPCYEMVVST
jgi:hypothetical protein